MSIGYNLPRIHKIIQEDDFHLKLQSNEKTETLHNPLIKINKTHAFYLQQAKMEIQKYEKKWDFYKKFTNPYEFINTSIYDEKTVASYIPISRAYFKMVEIIQHFNLLNDLPKQTMRSFHLAEGPGGFIEAIVNLRQNIFDDYYGMTLIDKTDTHIPSWKKSYSLMKKNPNIKLEYGEDGTGDLYSYMNLKYCHTKYSHEMNFITADGGFDFSTDYQNQEEMIWKLLYAQVVFALTLQKNDGIFILKCFDLFQENTIDLIFLLSCFYDTVTIYKPQTSRHANSEKYIICKKFRQDLYVDKIRIQLWNIFVHIMTKPMNIQRIFKFEIPYVFINRLTEINAIYAQQQIENIFSTVHLIQQIENKSPFIKLMKYYDKHIIKCLHWCKKYNVAHLSDFLIKQSKGVIINHLRDYKSGVDISNNYYVDKQTQSIFNNRYKQRRYSLIRHASS
jgi:23S rRNA U2552 (ribose-2'-O)-methylase RlmE/FtsJ